MLVDDKLATQSTQSPVPCTLAAKSTARSILLDKYINSTVRCSCYVTATNKLH